MEDLSYDSDFALTNAGTISRRLTMIEQRNKDIRKDVDSNVKECDRVFWIEGAQENIIRELQELKATVKKLEAEVRVLKLKTNKRKRAPDTEHQSCDCSPTSPAGCTCTPSNF